MRAPSLRRVVARFVEPGFHHWPDAVTHRGYLAHRHRHLFHMEVAVSVEHGDRDVEFHDLLDHARSAWPGPELGRMSCEDVAEVIAAALDQRWPGRRVEVSVFEDGEAGAVVTWEA